MTNYKKAKLIILSISIATKEGFKDDKPMIRQILNDSSYEISKDLKLSEYQSNLLSNYCCKLHPK